MAVGSGLLLLLPCRRLQVDQRAEGRGGVVQVVKGEQVFQHGHRVDGERPPPLRKHAQNFRVRQVAVPLVLGVPDQVLQEGRAQRPVVVVAFEELYAVVGAVVVVIDIFLMETIAMDACYCREWQ